MAKKKKSTDLKLNVLCVLERIKNKIENPDYDGEIEVQANSLDFITPHPRKPLGLQPRG